MKNSYSITGDGIKNCRRIKQKRNEQTKQTKQVATNKSSNKGEIQCTPGTEHSENL